MPLLKIDWSLQRSIARNDTDDNYLTALLKLVPAEAVAIYLAIWGYVPKEPVEATIGTKIISLAIMLGIGVATTIAFRYYATKEKNKGPDWKLIGLSVASFVVWSYATANVWESAGIYVKWIGSILVVLITSLAPLLYGGTLPPIPAKEEQGS